MIATAAIRSTVARWLEEGRLSALWPITRVHEGLAAQTLARPLTLPRGIKVVTVGGATLGGSGKTRVAIAVVRALAARGVRVVLVGHAYRARPGRARIVAADDALAVVGDEARTCARELGEIAPVVVGPSRQSAVDLATRLDPLVIVIDGPLQTAPVRASLAILAVDAQAPWGSGALAPVGDLRAPRAALLAHSDLLVSVDATPAGATVDGLRVPLASLVSRRLGLFTALARPARLESALGRAGLVLGAVVRAPDHGPVPVGRVAQVRAAPVDLWLATGKCVNHLAPLTTAPIAVLDGIYEPEPALLDALSELAHPSSGLPTRGSP